MKAAAFFEKWNNKDLTRINYVELEEFQNDIWALSGEDRPQPPDVAFMNKWTKSVDVYEHRQEFGDDVRKLLEWAEEEGVRKFLGKYNK